MILYYRRRLMWFSGLSTLLQEMETGTSMMWDTASDWSLSFLSLKARGRGKGIETNTTFDNSPCNYDFGDTEYSFGDTYEGILLILWWYWRNTSHLMVMLEGYFIFLWWYWMDTEYSHGDTEGILNIFMVLLEAICRKGHDERPRFLYVWRHPAAEWSPCTVTCGPGGTATKRAQCFKVMSEVAKTSKGNQVEDSFCDQALRPQDLVGPCPGLLSFCISWGYSLYIWLAITWICRSMGQV